MKFKIHVFIYCLTLIMMIISCGPSKLHRNVYEVTAPQGIPESSKVIKTHMNNGDLYVFTSWDFDNTDHIMHGTGSHYDALRNELSKKSDYAISLNDIALFESNAVDNHGQTGQTVAMSAVSLLNLILSVSCITDPKACFGSCPTYYAYNGREMSLQGEGFSSSMAKVYEQEDLDMLYDVDNNADTFKLEIRNEAFETHMIRYCDLLVIPRNETERVFAKSDGTFYTSSRTIGPENCMTGEGDILPKIKYYDEIEYYSKADSTNLIKKETIDLTFPNDQKKYGLVITSRQTLLTTYLFYQTMAYFGKTLPYWTTKLEKGNKLLKKRGLNIYKLLGGIEIYIKNSDHKWIKVGEVDEMGPIASDFHLIELPDIEGEKINIRIEMTQGLWRIDYITLAELDGKVDPIRIQPNQLIKEGSNHAENLLTLNDTDQYLVTFPGEKYIAHYNLPNNESLYEYFILSKGYYLEWMREEWLEEENKNMITMLFMRPKKYLREMAPKFKKAEPFMDEIFWNSKIQTH